MALTILHNAGAATANRTLVGNDQSVSRSVAKLSVGARVLSARDDAAALAIGTGLRKEVSAIRQAEVNAGQAVSMLQIADGAAQQIDSSLMRMKTLSVQAGSDQLSNTERALIDVEYQALKSELDRIAKSTAFNGQSLLQGDTENGLIYTLRSLPQSGVLQRDGQALALGESFSQNDIDLGRITYNHDDAGAGADSDRLIVTVADAEGNALGSVVGEGDRSSFETAEYFASTALDNIFASAAYARGATGAGVRVAVIDTGVDLDHSDLDANINVDESVDIVDGVWDGLGVSLDAVANGSGALANVSHLGGPDQLELLAPSLTALFPGLTTAEIEARIPEVFLTSDNLLGLDASGSLNLTFAGDATNATVTLETNLGTFSNVTFAIDLTTANYQLPADRNLIFLENDSGDEIIALQIDASGITAAGALTGGPVDISAIFTGAGATPTSGDGNDDNVGAGASGHGTHVAGIVAAERNGVGTHGVAYEAEIVAINVGRDTGDPDGPIHTDDVADAINHARRIGARVINLSLGSDSSIIDPDVATAIRDAVNAGIVIVAATGNGDQLGIGRPAPGSPANFGIDEDAQGMLIAVTATDDANAIAGFANKAGAIKDFTLAAPGVSIVSTTNDGGHGVLSGTSMATPMVTGAVALLMDLNPEMTGAEIVSLLSTSTTDLGAPGIDEVFGQGLINLDKATLPQLTLSINIDSSTSVAGALNLRPGESTFLDTSLIDISDAYSGKIDVADRSLGFKVGTGVDSSDRITVSIGALTAASLGLAQSAIGTAAGADESSEIIDTALEDLNRVRSQIGASQNRLEFALRNLATMAANTEISRSSLIDLDVAREMMRFTSSQILVQANIGMSAQANSQNQVLLRLLQ